MTTGECPYCHVGLDPVPKRARACRSCGQKIYIRNGLLVTAADARKHDEESGSPHKWLTPAERLAERRKNALQEVENCKQLDGIVTHMKVESVNMGHAQCEFCRMMTGQTFRLDECTPEIMPPFEGCTTEGGCACWLSAVMVDPDDIGR